MEAGGRCPAGRKHAFRHRCGRRWRYSQPRTGERQQGRANHQPPRAPAVGAARTARPRWSAALSATTAPAAVHHATAQTSSRTRSQAPGGGRRGGRRGGSRSKAWQPTANASTARSKCAQPTKEPGAAGREGGSQEVQGSEWAGWQQAQAAFLFVCRTAGAARQPPCAGVRYAAEWWHT